jgi:hypothetical protein
MQRNFIYNIVTEFRTLFGISKSFIKNRKETQLTEYFKLVEKDIDCAFQKIRNEYERE